MRGFANLPSMEIGCEQKRNRASLCILNPFVFASFLFVIKRWLAAFRLFSNLYFNLIFFPFPPILFCFSNIDIAREVVVQMIGWMD